MGCDCKVCECKIRDSVIKGIKIYLCDQNLEVKPESNLVELGFESLEIVEYQLEVEDKFSIEIKEHEMDKVHVVQDLINLIYSKAR